MRVRADFSRPEIVDTTLVEWVPSPAPGVERKMLDRVGDEVARATSLVRYAPGSRFDPHVHDHGEEFLVLEGVFTDESGEFPAGTYVRNPPGSSHAPASIRGCVIFVKLRQFAPNDLTRVIVDTDVVDLAPATDRPGVARTDLHRHGAEHVSVETWASGAAGVDGRTPGGLELLVLDGALRADGTVHSTGTWMRFPESEAPVLTAGPDGARLWIKRGVVSA